MKNIKLYRPSNGSEGECFRAKFCDRCEHDDAHNFREQGEKLCPILGNSLLLDINDPQYPQEWQYQDGQPTCTSFQLHVESELEIQKLKAICRDQRKRRIIHWLKVRNPIMRTVRCLKFWRELVNTNDPEFQNSSWFWFKIAFNIWR